MVNPAVMGSTSPDGISYLVSGSPVNPVSESAQQASTIQTALAKRPMFNYVWANDAGRTAQTGMREGDTAYQQDKDQPYWYLGSTFGWAPVMISHPSMGGGRSITGFVLITPTGSGPYTGSVTVTFPTGFFTATPQVQTSPSTVSPGACATSFQHSSAASVDIYLARTDGAYATGVSWTATQ